MSANGKTVYIEVEARFTLLGQVIPLEVIWSDGRRFAVTRVRSVSNASPRAASVCPVRYDCEIEGERRCLYYDCNISLWTLFVFVVMIRK